MATQRPKTTISPGSHNSKLLRKSLTRNEMQFGTDIFTIDFLDGRNIVTLTNIRILLVDTGNVSVQWTRVNSIVHPYAHPWFVLTLMSLGQEIGPIRMIEIDDMGGCGVPHLENRFGTFEAALLPDVDHIQIADPGCAWQYC